MSNEISKTKTITPFNEVPSSVMPKMGNSLTRFIGRSIMRMMGWSFRGRLPETKKVVFIGAPHTSNWDLIIALSAMMAVGLKCSWMMKKEAFFWPLGGLWKAMGGIAIDRSAARSVPEQTADWFNANEFAWLGITPEGTRSKVTQYKKGYLRMAYAAEVPIFLIAIDGKKKQIVLDKLWELSGDINTDNDAIKAYYDANFVGINPEKS